MDNNSNMIIDYEDMIQLDPKHFRFLLVKFYEETKR